MHVTYTLEKKEAMVYHVHKTGTQSSGFDVVETVRSIPRAAHRRSFHLVTQKCVANPTAKTVRIRIIGGSLEATDAPLPYLPILVSRRPKDERLEDGHITQLIR